MRVKTSAVLATVALLLVGCTTVQSMFDQSSEKEPEIFLTPVLTVKPDIDYTAEYPSCVVAAQRLTDNVKIGMTLKDVTRLVGQPRYKMPGSWWWSKSFSKSGKPLVRFDLQRGRDDTTVTAIETNTDQCE